MASCKFCGDKEPVMHCVCAGCMDKLERQRWISVKDKCPGAALPVLICRKRWFGDLVVGEGYLTARGWHNASHALIKGVTHWMELPPPPKEI